MTIGSTVKTWSHTIVPYENDYNCASWFLTTLAAKPTGRYFSKTWSGVDDPPVRPDYYDVYYRFGGKTRHKKIRLSGPTRIDRGDHNYSTEIVSIQSTAFLKVTRGLCNTGWPTFVNYTTVKNLMVNDSFGSQNPIVGPTYEWNSNDDLALLGRLRNAVAGNEINFSVFLGEGREALKLITSTVEQLTHAIIFAKRGRFDAAARVLGLKAKKPIAGKLRDNSKEQVAARWLELQYGWLPLLGDVYNAAEFLARSLDAPFVKNYRVRYRRKGTFSYNNTKPRLAECYTQKQIIARLSEVSVPTLVGLTDPLSVAWELMPFSFIADWFIPIGNYLAARGLAQSLTGTFVTTTTKRFRFWTDNYGPIGLATWENYYVDYRYVKVDRVVSTSLSVPMPSIKPLSAAMSWKHCANAVALVTSIFAKK